MDLFDLCHGWEHHDTQNSENLLTHLSHHVPMHMHVGVVYSPACVTAGVVCVYEKEGEGDEVAVTVSEC